MTARRPQRSWYTRKRVILPAIVLVGLAGFGAVQNSSNGSQPGGEVILADSPTPAQAASHPPKKPKKKKTTEPVAAPPPTTKKAKPHKNRTTQAPAPDPTQAPKPKAKPKKSKKPKPASSTTTSNCDENYAQACVPIAYDVDCAGGGGNGPAYFSGTAKVVGDDIYDLDRDGDGWVCDT